MNKLIYVLLMISCSIGISAQQKENIIAGTKETFFSRTLQESRKIWIYHPRFSSAHSDSNFRYPVLYVLDGDAHFFSTVGIVQQLSQANGNGVLPEMIVVGIENTNRLRDLTPILSPDGSMEKANPFLAFLTKELIPYIDTRYHAAPYKVLIGHSLGGLTTVDVMTSFPGIFNAYIAVDPSMWFLNEKFLKHAIAQLPMHSLEGKRLFIGTANTLPSGMSLSQIGTDRSPETQHIRSIFRLDSVLRRAHNGLYYAQKYYDHESHNTVPLVSVYDGLRFIFDYYLFNANEKDFVDTSAKLASSLRAHYQKVSTAMGYPVAAPASFVNYMGYDALNKKQFSKAEALFKLNIDNYPANPKVYDAYGDYLVVRKDTPNAVTYYKKSLALADNPLARYNIQTLSGRESFRLSPEALGRYAGVYMLDAYQMAIVLELRNGKLWTKVPGQVDDELVPVASNVFTLKNKRGYTISFHMQGKMPVGFTAVQPNGTFKATYKNAR